MGDLAQFSDRIIAEVVRSSAPSVLTRYPPATAPPGQMTTGNDQPIRKLLTVREVALALHCHPETIYRQIKADDLPAKRHGKRWKFDPLEVTAWLEQRTGMVKKPIAEVEARRDAE